MVNGGVSGNGSGCGVSNSGVSSGRISPLRRSSRDLITGLSQLTEEEDEEDEEIVSNKDVVNTVKREKVDLVAPLEKLDTRQDSSYIETDDTLKKRQLIVIAFIILGVVMFQFGIVSISDFRIRVLRPFVLRVVKWL